ncbi:histidine phosphatase family protein [Kibdelosporangium phytohabitans]|uniref:Phosphoglycerate kinase n=1 Tax=Kibdelosporangium phytohabitans TaxID=860235 RepID=A0A0N9I5M6_9PSEU|nr:histidine phosphatase family protein [Kibdelosporangium phytohabitans]ALG10179.1 phosphoglycerate kinase [Kibdelosporangium phytohabitans]MBE1461188.1 putative phosphoglycerate mutase [Kibdelosporangium phytohabitans]
MARTIHVVTHPQATHHLDGLVGGWHDSELTPAGLRDAHVIAQALRARIPHEAQVHTSDLTRTAHTAAVIGDALGTTPVPDRRLREISYGDAEGRPQAWLDERFVPPPAGGDRLRHDFGVPGAETRESCARRVYAAMDDILARPGEQQVIVTHGFAVTFVVAAWIGMPLPAAGLVAFPVSPGSITVLRQDDFFRNRALVSLGETGHLVS